MKKFSLLILVSVFFSSCSLFDTKEDVFQIDENSCQKVCKKQDKSYQGYDKSVGCFCGVK